MNVREKEKKGGGRVGCWYASTSKRPPHKRELLGNETKKLR